MEHFASPQDVAVRLRGQGYIPDPPTADVVFLADRLSKPVLAEGPAGTGKTELAKSTAAAVGARLIRLQCYEGLEESKAIYEWNYRKQLLRLQAQSALEGAGSKAGSWAELEADLFSEEFLLARPLLEAIRAADPVVLLIDEVDRLEVETEALLLEVLSDYQVSIPEMGTLHATQVPLVFLTSNGTRELSEALKRRCLYCYIDYPEPAREREIVFSKVPGIGERLASQVVEIVSMLRTMPMKKHPSISETLDWARALQLMGAEEAATSAVLQTLPVVLKHKSDIAAAAVAISGREKVPQDADRPR